jgi:hypothetical protein
MFCKINYIYCPQIWFCLCLLLVSLALSAAAPNPAFFLVETQESHMHVIAACTATKIPFMYSFSGNCARPQSQYFHIHLSVSDLYICIPRIGPHIFLQQKRQIDGGREYIHRSQNTWMWNYNVLFNSYSHISVRDLFISRIGLSILLLPDMWTDSGNI